MATFVFHPLAFINFMTWPFFWAGLGLVSIPILIHLLNRRRFKVIDWAAMEYLLRAMRKNRRRMKFEQWLLLATRCLLIFLIAFALARPLVGCSKSSLAGQIAGRSGLNVFVIDNSYSTAYEAVHPGPSGAVGGKTHLEQEKLIAKRLIDSLNAGGESVAIITAARPDGSSNPPADAPAADARPPAAGGADGANKDAKKSAPVTAWVVMRPGYDLNAAKAAIDRIEQSYGGTDIAGALQVALKIAEDEPKVAQKNLYLLTDGTQSAWQGAQSDAIRRAGVEVAKHYRVTHFNMTEGRQQWNQAILDIRPTSSLLNTKFNTDLRLDARGYGAGPDASIQWTLDGTSYGNPIVAQLTPNESDKPDGKLKMTLLASDLKRGGPHLVSVSINGGTGDPVKFDNTRQRVLDIASELKVLIVEGKRGTKALDGSGAFLQLALAAPAEVAPGVDGPRSASYVSAELISDIELQSKLLADYRAVVLAGVSQVSEAEADSLQRFVEAGGTLMVFMGDTVSKENYNAVMLPRKLMPGPLIKLVDGSEGKGFFFNFKPNQTPNRFLTQFYGIQNSGLDTANVHIYWQADIPPDTGVERILDYLPAPDRNGVAPPAGIVDPAITHHALGLGHVLFFSTSAGTGSPDKPWTDFPARPAYVELMHELLGAGVSSGDFWMNLTVGQSLQIPPNVKLSGAPELKDEANASILIDPTTEKDPQSGQPRAVYRSRPLNKPGVYTLSLGNGNTVPIAVNVPADEADVRTVGNEAIRTALGNIDVSLQNDEVPADAALAADANDWAGPVLLAVLALLAVECFMAMRFGHYRRAEVARA